jgi:hypothetical protein
MGQPIHTIHNSLSRQKGAVAISNSPEFNMRIVKPGPVKSPGFVVKFKYDQTLNLTREL